MDIRNFFSVLDKNQINMKTLAPLDVTNVKPLLPLGSYNSE